MYKMVLYIPNIDLTYSCLQRTYCKGHIDETQHMQCVSSCKIKNKSMLIVANDILWKKYLVVNSDKCQDYMTKRMPTYQEL